MNNFVQLFGCYDSISKSDLYGTTISRLQSILFPKNVFEVISSLPQHLKLVWSRTFEWEVNDKIENDFSKLLYL